jgi:hypothetical protein
MMVQEILNFGDSKTRLSGQTLSIPAQGAGDQATMEA